MKVLTVGNFTTGWDGSICDEEHIAKALEDLGHDVTRWQREEVKMSSMNLTKYDFALIAQWNGYPDHIMSILKKHSDAVVYWAFDYQWKDKEPWHMRLAREADLFLSKELAHMRDYEIMGAKFRWLSQDFAPEFLDRVEGREKVIDVLFTGSFLPWATERNEIIKKVDKNFNLVVHSVTPGEWTRFGIKDSRGPVMDHDLPELYARAKVNLSIDHVNSMGYWSDRNAQIMACGGFVLFRHVPLSETVFRDHIGYFYDAENCLDKIGHYLRDSERREFVADEGYEYAQEYLKVRNRVEDMLIILEEVL